MRSRKVGTSLLAILTAGVTASPAFAAGTPAGTDISNVATATFNLPDGTEREETSNTVVLKVDELLDVSVAPAADVATSPGGSGQVLTFMVTNAGNGSEAFSLATQDNAGGDDFNPSATSIVIDSNDNGVYDAGVDTVYSGSNHPVLAPDASISIFVLSSIPGTAADGERGRVDLTATAVTGSGAPGLSFAGEGQGGGDAVVGATGAEADNSGNYLISAANVAFVKSVSVQDQFGGSTKVPGATITYTLVATVSGTGSVSNMAISDQIPANTTYKPASITLEGSGLPDASNFNGTAINVNVGTVPAGESRTVTFQTIIDGE